MHANKAAAHLWCSIYTSTQLFFPLPHPPTPRLPFFLPCPGSSVGGHDESPGDHAATDAADPPAAGAFPSAAPGPAPAAAGCYATAGWLHTQHLSILFVFLTNKKNQEFWFWRWTLTAAQRPWHSHCELLLESPLINCTSRPIGPISWQASIRDSWESRAQSDRTMKAEWRVIDDVIFGAVFCQRRSTFLTHGYHWKKKRELFN